MKTGLNRIPSEFARPKNVKFIVIDNVLSDDDRLNAAAMAEANLNEKSNYSQYFYAGQNKIIDSLIDQARKYFDLSGCQYYEMWANDHGVGMHLDMEPNAWNKDKSVVLPMCTLVYYPVVELESGGKFFTDDIELVPKQNSMVIFSAGIYHGVESFTGKRLSLAINPIDREFKIERPADILRNNLKNMFKKKS